MFKKKFKEEVFETELIIIYWKIIEFWLDVWDFDGLYNRKWVIYLKEWCNIEKTLSHEILHFVYDMLLERDISLTKQTEEMFAYLIWFYFDKTYKWLIKQIELSQKIEKK